MGEPKIQDDITINLQVQKMVTHENVRINVSIQAQVDPETPEPSFRKEIHQKLRSFIPGDWKIQSITRQKGNQFENAYVNATVRVSDKEDYQLEARAAKVSRIGFELINPRSEYELTFDEVQAVQAELRLMLVKQALVECTTYNIAAREAGYPNPRYRISSTRFDSGSVAKSANNRVAQFSMASAPVMIAASASAMPTSVYTADVVAGASFEDEFSDDAVEVEGTDDIGVTSRFSMTGMFVLRSVHG